MPTTRPRHIITETDDIASALDDAARRWPEDASSRAALLRRLVEEGHRAVVEWRARDREERRRAIQRAAGSMTGVYGPDYLEELRREWPE